MLFYFMLFGPVVLVALVLLMGALSRSDIDDTMACAFGAFIIGIVPLVIAVGSWHGQSSDLSRISTQDQIIQVQLDRIESLNERLESFDYPKGALLNRDSPVSSIVASLTNAEESLAIAKHERAEAYRSIEARRLGPMGGAVSFVGD